MTILLFTLVAFALAMLVMSVGVVFSGRCLRGSCGGPEVLGPDGEPLSCATCPHREEHEAEARRRRAAEGDEPGPLTVLR